MYSFIRNVWLAFCILFSWNTHTLHAASFGSKIALVIGNSEYINIPRLKNASNDARAVAHALSDKGFTVFFAQDASTKELRNILSFTALQAAHADQLVIYYAGHNKIKNGTTELLGVESTGQTDAIAITIPELLRYFNAPFTQKAVILDTCLQNPPESMLTEQQTLFLPNALGLETLLVFATTFGQVAYDGTGQHSIFTGALLDYMAKNKYNLQNTLQSVRKQVIKNSRSNQIPVSISTLTRPYILNTSPSVSQNTSSQNTLIQSYSSSGYADKPLLRTIAVGLNPSGF
ncbi:MAG: caspase family protein [Rhodobacterales bacterium]